MPENYEVIVSPAAEWSLQDIESFKVDSIGASKASKFVDDMLLSFIDAIAEDPARYRFNGRLAEKGIMFRERLDPDNEYRVLYDFDGKKIFILIFISMKQDIEKTLYRYLMSR